MLLALSLSPQVLKRLQLTLELVKKEMEISKIQVIVSETSGTACFFQFVILA